jgi:hypothetical protein
MKPDHETTDSESSAVIRPTNPAANAVKHGFCAKKILTPETYARAEVIREELTRIHEPWSDEEIDAIATLSLARAQQFELELAMRAKVDDAKARAAEVHERNARDRLNADLAKFRDKPGIYGPVLGMTWHGADWLVKLWRLIADLLMPDSNGQPGCLPFHLACDAAAALGGPWQVDRTGFDSAWVMARFVRISPEPEAAIELWANESQAVDGRKFALTYARRLVDKAPADPAVAASELHSRATGELDRITLQCNRLRVNYETELALAAEASVGTGSGDLAMEQSFRLLTRYLTAARNRADRVERRLDSLKRDRKRLAYRSQRDMEQEAHRLRRESEKALSRYENETAPGSRDWAKYHGNIDYPVNEIFSTQSHMRKSAGDSAHETAGMNGVEPQKPVTEECAQHIAYKNDAVELRNEECEQEAGGSMFCATLPSLEKEQSKVGIAASIPVDLTDLSGWALPASDAEGAAERAKLAELTAKGGSFTERAKLFKYRDWGNPAEVQEDEAAFLRNLKSLPDSFDKGVLVRTFFGTQGTFRRSWRAYSEWADAALIAAAEESYPSDEP